MILTRASRHIQRGTRFASALMCGALPREEVQNTMEIIGIFNTKY